MKIFVTLQPLMTGDRRPTRILRCISSLMLVLFVSFSISTSMFVHRHTIDGVTVTHSHPFTTANHTHNAQEAVSLAFASHFISEEAGGFDIVTTPYISFDILSWFAGDMTGCLRAIGRESLPAPPVD